MENSAGASDGKLSSACWPECRRRYALNSSGVAAESSPEPLLIGWRDVGIQPLRMT